MFETTRLKLTAWYLVIIMTISLLFSLAIYNRVNSEFTRFERVQMIIRERQELGLPVRKFQIAHPPDLDPKLIQNARIRLITSLGVINLAILGISGAAGYFLAGRTLRPIKEMVDDQNRFIADASHELRTPLTSLRSEIEVGLRNKTMTLAEAKQLLASNLEETIHLQTLSDSLLELAQSGKQNGKDMTDVSISECIDTAVKKMNGQIKKKGITIKRTGETAMVRGIADRICELLVILIDNAVKYSPKKTTVTIGVKKLDGSAQIKISDQGYGIDEEDLPHIFDRFYRVSKSRSKEEIPGYGLGLSIAKKIIDDHNGKITVASKVNKGTTFTVKLPAIKETKGH